MASNQIVGCSMPKKEGFSLLRDQDVAMFILKDFSAQAKPGKALIGIWKNKEDYGMWKFLSLDDTKPIRVTVVDSDTLPIQVENKKDVVIVGLGIGVEADYSDVIIFYHLVAKRKSIPSKQEETAT